MVGYYDLKFYGGTILIALEVIWMIWYVGLNTAIQIKDDNEKLRNAAFIQGIHIGVILAIILVIGINKKHIHVYIIFLFIFEMIRDIFVISNNIRNEYTELLAISIYQLVLSSLAFIWCAVLIAKNPSTFMDYHKK